MRASSYIGNDIVDISSPENLTKSANQRLVHRVLSATEQSALTASKEHALVFLAIWAAKESAYKLLKKKEDDLLFAHAQFEVRGAERLQRDSNFTGTVQHPAFEPVQVQWQLNKLWIHCVALEQRKPAHFVTGIEHISAELIRGDFSARELESIYSDQSRAARNLGKRLLKQVGVHPAQIIRHKEQRRYSPPWVYVEDKRVMNLDISLSHDGNFTAAVLASDNGPPATNV